MHTTAAYYRTHEVSREAQCALDIPVKICTREDVGPWHYPGVALAHKQSLSIHDPEDCSY